MTPTPTAHKPPIRITLADDERMVRTALRAILSASAVRPAPRATLTTEPDPPGTTPDGPSPCLPLKDPT